MGSSLGLAVLQNGNKGEINISIQMLCSSKINPKVYHSNVAICTAIAGFSSASELSVCLERIKAEYERERERKQEEERERARERRKKKKRGEREREREHKSICISDAAEARRLGENRPRRPEKSEHLDRISNAPLDYEGLG